MNWKKIHQLEKNMWRQKAHFLWLTQGDHNSKMIHSVPNARYRYNLIQMLHHNGKILPTHLDISNALTSYFSKIFGASHCLLFAY